MIPTVVCWNQIMSQRFSLADIQYKNLKYRLRHAADLRGVGLDYGQQQTLGFNLQMFW